MPNVAMPDGTVVNMPDQLDDETGKRLRAFLSDEQDKQTTAKNVAAMPHTMTTDPLEEGEEHAANATESFMRHPLTSGVGMLENTLSGVTHSIGAAQDAVFNHGAPDSGQHWYEYEPHTEAGKEQQQLLGQESERMGQGFHNVLDQTPLSDAAKQTIEERAPQALSAASAPLLAAGAVRGGVGAVRAAGRAADTAINAAAPASGAAADTIASNPAIANTRAAGFRLTGGDVRNAVNGPTPGEAAEIPGSTRQSIAGEGAIDANQRFNRALATQKMTQDLGLQNTRAVDPDQVDVARQQAGSVYDEMGQSIGRGRTPTPQLDREINSAGQRAASPAGRDMVDQQVQFYRDQYGQGFNGPDAVQDVRTLRQQAYKQMANDNPDVQVLGATNREIANAIENEMMRQVDVRGAVSDLPQRFTAARQQLAKLHELNAVTQQGQVVPSLVNRLLKNGAPLTGGARDVAEAFDAAPESMSIGPGDPAARVPAVNTHAGAFRAVQGAVRSVARHLPGMDPTTEAFQEANYGPAGQEPINAAGPPKPPPPLAMEPPPGVVGRAPPAQGELPLRVPPNTSAVETGVARQRPPEAGRVVQVPANADIHPPPGSTATTGGHTEVPPVPSNEETANATRGFTRGPKEPGKNLSRRGFDEELLRRLRERGGG